MFLRIARILALKFKDLSRDAPRKAAFSTQIHPLARISRRVAAVGDRRALPSFQAARRCQSAAAGALREFPIYEF
jgi:hypothetical protein